MNRKYILFFLIKTIGILSIIAAAYYLTVLRPMTDAFPETKKILARQEAILLQNRLAIIQLAKLNPLSARYIYSRARVYEIVETTKTQGQELIKESLPSTLPELAQEYPQMQAEYVNILMSQHEFIQKQKELDEKLGPIFEYFPRRDLEGVTAAEKRARLEAAIEGLEKIKQNLPETSEIIEETIVVLRSGDVDKISLQFRKLKTELFKIKLAEIESEEELALLARQTNLLNKYRYFSGKLTRQTLPLQWAGN